MRKSLKASEVVSGIDLTKSEKEIKQCEHGCETSIKNK